MPINTTKPPSSSSGDDGGNSSSSDHGGDSTSDQRFHAAADHVASLVAADPAALPDQTKLRLYGLYKQATSGPCGAPKPAFWHRAARLKWDHWHRLKDLSSEAAQAQYIELVSECDPGWQQAAAAAGAGQQRRQRQAGGAGGPVFSTMRDTAAEAAAAQQSSSGAASLHELAGQGDATALQRALAAGAAGAGAAAAVDTRDDTGCTPLHFAADRGQLESIQLLLGAGADINARDADGQTPLHYAALCEQRGACELLLRHGADAGARDTEGQTPVQVGPSGWTGVWSTRTMTVNDE